MNHHEENQGHQHPLEDFVCRGRRAAGGGIDPGRVAGQRYPQRGRGGHCRKEPGRRLHGRIGP
ncbi:hypothetical protein DESC_660047 [Desulfosarcina cetonica]|nr:hypothetical protein DESC_660047 [Desulfosarcina cetonica]